MRTALLLLLTVGSWPGAARSQDTASSVANVIVDAVDLVSVGPAQIVLQVQSHVVSTRRVTVKRVEFQELEANGIPLAIQPIVQRLELLANQPVQLERVDVTLRTKDIHSIEPLVAAASDGRITLSGRARMDLDLTFLERLFSGHPSGKADVAIRGEIPFEVPGGAAGRTGVVLALRALELAIGVAASVLH